MAETNPYYTEAFTGASGQTARAESVKSEFDGVQAGFDGVLSSILQTISAPEGEELQNLPPISSRMNKWLRFNASGDPVVVDSPLNVRGAWQASTTYNVGDAYTSSPNGSLYYVKTQYTSGATFGATDLANTIILVNLAGLYFANYQLISGPATVAAEAGKSYAIDSTGGDVTVNLPTTTMGDSPINITHVGGSLATGHAINIVSASGQFIMGSTENTLNIDVANASISMAYVTSPFGWRLRTMG